MAPANGAPATADGKYKERRSIKAQKKRLISINFPKFNKIN